MWLNTPYYIITLFIYIHIFIWIKYVTFNICLWYFQTDEEEVITFLLSTEIIPLCLRIMESGSELSKTVATFILQKILLDEKGLSYICQTFERFSHVAIILVSLHLHEKWIHSAKISKFDCFSLFQGKMVIHLAKEPSVRLLKHVVRCYLRLSDNKRLVFLKTISYNIYIYDSIYF